MSRAKSAAHFLLICVVSLTAGCKLAVIVVEGGRRPAVLSVTLPAVALEVLMQAINRVVVTTITLLLPGRFQKLMGELTDGAESLNTFMVTVASDTLLYK